MKTIALVLLLIAALALLSACSPAAVPATEASAPSGGTTGGEAADWSTVKPAAEASGMDALVAAAKAEGDRNVISLPRETRANCCALNDFKL